MKKTVAIICSRIQSSRLPGKVFKKIAGVPAIVHMLRRVQKIGVDTVLAVPFGETDKYIQVMTDAGFNHKWLTLFEGHPASPLHRMKEYLETYGKKYDMVLRATHDDILIDPQTAVEMIAAARDGNFDYVNCSGILEGAGVELFKAKSVINAAKKRNEPTEFLSYFVKPKRKSRAHDMPARESVTRPYRLTMDYPQDALLLDILLKKLGSNASVDRIAKLIDQNKYLTNINRLPDVSFYTCAHNASKWLGQTVSSIPRSLESWKSEYIFIDDASTDDTLLKLAQVYSGRHIYFEVNEKNLGLSASANIALRYCKGKYIMRVDADDILLSGAATELFGEMERTGADILYPAYSEVDENGEIINLYVNPSIHHHAGCALMRARAINELRFRDGLRHWDGLDLYKRAKKAGLKIRYYDKPAWIYRRHKGSLSDKMTPERGKALKEVARGS